MKHAQITAAQAETEALNFNGADRAYAAFAREIFAYDAHMDALDAACETPAGLDRAYLNAVRDEARARLDGFKRNPVSTAGSATFIQGSIDIRIRQTERYKAIVRYATILLEGVPVEFEDAAVELACWIDEDTSMFERDALARMRKAAA